MSDHHHVNRSRGTTGITSDSRFEAKGPGEIHVQILHVPDCPLVEGLRTLLDRCIWQSGLSATIEEVEGPYPSPTLLVNGADVTGRPTGFEPSCRLDRPTEREIVAALNHAVAPSVLLDLSDGDERCA